MQQSIQLLNSETLNPKPFLAFLPKMPKLTVCTAGSNSYYTCDINSAIFTEKTEKVPHSFSVTLNSTILK